MEHIKASDVSLLTRPDLLAYRGTELPWHVRSERGEVSPGGEQVELIDDVVVERTDAKGRPTVVTTSRMTVWPEKDYAETRQAVRIDAANGVTTANGMKAYLDDGRMLLLSNVRGQHELR
jgi:lipopolysaccharide export system protein LptC